MTFVADDLAAWLIGLLADAGLKRLTVFVRGTPQERALRSAAATAIERTALEFVPAGGERAESFARVVDQVFEAPPGPTVATSQLTVLEALQAGVAGRLAVLGDATVTGTGRSSADVLGVDITQLTEALTRQLLQEIIHQGADGGALAPLAGQLNHDVTHLQARQLQGMVGQLSAAVQETLRRLDSTQQAALQAASSGPLDPVFSHYFEPLARGVQRAGIVGWYFTGRESVLREIVTWLAERSYGALIVTGEPGSGKSAVLARIVTMADAGYRATVPPAVLDAAPPGTLPPEGSIDAAIRASGMTTVGTAQAIAAKLGLVAAGTDELIDQVLARGAMTTMVLDAVDEADDPEELWAELIAPLAQYARTGEIRLLLGVRPKSVRKLHGSRTMNLDSADYFRKADIAGYVASYLRGHGRSRFGDFAHDPEAASRMGWRIAHNAGFSFLIAHLTAMSVVESQGDDPGNLPSTVGEALDQSLHRIAKALAKLGPGDRERTVQGWRLWIRELLTALAYTEGEGPDDELWASLATMMGTGTYSLQDVRLLRDKSPAGDLLQGDAAATRLFHAALAEHLREEAGRPDSDQEISELLITLMSSRVSGGAIAWDTAPAYTQHHLATHAGRAGMLDALMLDVGYLLAADPVRLLAQLPSLTDPKAQQVARVYQLTAHRLRGVNRRSAASALGLTALLSEVRWFADAIAAVLTMTAEPLWAHWQPVSPHRQLIGHEAPVRSVAVCQVGDSLLVVSGAEDGKVLVWDYATTLETEILDDPLPGPVTAVAAAERMLVAGFRVNASTWFRDLRGQHAIGGEHALQASLGIVDGRPIVASGDNLIELRNLDTGDNAGGPFDHSEAPLTALSFSKVGSTDLLMAACTEAKVHLWEIATMATVGILATRQEPITATAAHEIDGYLTIVAIHSNRVVQSWDVATGRPVGLPFVGHTGRVLAVTAGQFRGRPYVVTGGEDGTVRVWETSAAAYGSPAEHKGMRAVAIGRHGGSPIAVTADQTRMLQTWSLATGDEAGPPVAITGGAPAALALGRFAGYDSIAGLADEVGRIHLWDLTTAQRVLWRGTGNGWSSVLTVGTLDGRLVSAIGGLEPRRTIVVYDLETGDQVGAAITLSVAATTAFIGQINDRRLLVTTDRSNATAVWDLDSGRPYGRSIPLSGAMINVVALGNLHTGPVIATAGPSAPVHIWYLTRDEQITLDLGSTVTSLAFGDDDTMVVTADAGIACVRICGQAS